MGNRTPTAIVVVDQDGNHPGLTFETVEEGEHKTLTRALKFDNETGASSWVQNDEGQLPFRQSPDDDYSDSEQYGITWHFPR